MLDVGEMPRTWFMLTMSAVHPGSAPPGPSGMRELVVRAHLLRASLGDLAGTSAARMLALEIDNPVLSKLTGAGEIACA